ncbi:hypothetical protein [Nocardia aurantia]|uniref:Uncharacterized protein n=1 Tax=Nocardia aurantia TaxID=2585199 RepID=A0A7K0DRW8_9NOCA|nr:hypothetical protein [Nocardia aurantia]MQY28348.1 hypothetical protein [Nocardia aurantia]
MLVPPSFYRSLTSNRIRVQGFLMGYLRGKRIPIPDYIEHEIERTFNSDQLVMWLGRSMRAKSTADVFHELMDRHRAEQRAAGVAPSAATEPPR